MIAMAFISVVAVLSKIIALRGNIFFYDCKGRPFPLRHQANLFHKTCEINRFLDNKKELITFAKTFNYDVFKYLDHDWQNPTIYKYSSIDCTTCSSIRNMLLRYDEYTNSHNPSSTNNEG